MVARLWGELWLLGRLGRSAGGVISPPKIFEINAISEKNEEPGSLSPLTG